MPQYFHINQLAAAAPTSSPQETKAMLAEISEMFRNDYPLPEKGDPAPHRRFDIFLSYSTADSSSVIGLFVLLTRRTYEVYLDSQIDRTLDPSIVTRATAEVLRGRIMQSRTLFVATSHQTPQSAWVPWELGFADGWCGKAAVLPIVEHDGSSYS